MQDSTAISDWLFIPAQYTHSVDTLYSVISDSIFIFNYDTLYILRPEAEKYIDDFGWTEYRLNSSTVRLQWDYDFKDESGQPINIVRFEYGADGFKDYIKMFDWTYNPDVEPDTTFGWGLSWQATRGMGLEVWEGLLTGVPENMYIVFSVRAVSDGGFSEWHRSTWDDEPFYLFWER